MPSCGLSWIRTTASMAACPAWPIIRSPSQRHPATATASISSIIPAMWRRRSRNGKGWRICRGVHPPTTGFRWPATSVIPSCWTTSGPLTRKAARGPRRAACPSSHRATSPVSSMSCSRATTVSAIFSIVPTRCNTLAGHWSLLAGCSSRQDSFSRATRDSGLRKGR